MINKIKRVLPKPVYSGIETYILQMQGTNGRIAHSPEMPVRRHAMAPSPFCQGDKR
jgi:hypothetical protein